MHNRKKSSQTLSEAELNAINKKAFTYQSLIDIIFERRNAGDKSKETFELVGKLIRMNPDFYSLWNFRKEILINNIPALLEPTKLTGSDNDLVRDEELALSTDGIKKNPKSYCAWHHRVWIAFHFQLNYEHELSLCQEFLKEDQRNFHCWNYRRFLVKHGHINQQLELQFTEKKIQENFSNYSAFHHRSVFLSVAKDPLEDLIRNELSFVENAVFTEPDDQSAWWYHQFILSFTFSAVVNTYAEGNCLLSWYSDTLLQQLDLMKGLLEIEEKCRWVMTCLVSLLQRFNQLNDFAVSKGESLKDFESISVKEELNGYLTKLSEIDPLHSNRYLHLKL